MDMAKAYDRVDRKAFWDVLRIYCVGRQLLDSIKAFYRVASARENGGRAQISVLKLEWD